MTGIYKITSPTGKVYIGQSVCIVKRFINYSSLSNSKKQTKLHYSFTKYGISTHKFEIIEECYVLLLNERERFFQDKYKSVSDGLNCRATGTSEKSGYCSDETKIRISLSKKGVTPIFKNPLKRNDNIRKALIGKKLSVEHIESLRRAQTGLKRSPDAIRKSVESRRGFKMSDESKIKISKSQILGNNSFAKIVMNTDTGIYYDTAKQAAHSIGMTYNSFSHYINGRTKKKLPFIYI
jgi:group I intron endonuclease